MSYSGFDTLATRSVAAIEKYGLRQEVSSDIDRQEVYKGPNIRAFMVQNNLDPNKWRELLTRNQSGSLMDLIEGETQLSVYRDLSQ
jgi:hypothetical protein